MSCFLLLLLSRIILFFFFFFYTACIQQSSHFYFSNRLIRFTTPEKLLLRPCPCQFPYTLHSQKTLTAQQHSPPLEKKRKEENKKEEDGIALTKTNWKSFRGSCVYHPVRGSCRGSWTTTHKKGRRNIGKNSTLKLGNRRMVVHDKRPQERGTMPLVLDTQERNVIIYLHVSVEVGPSLRILNNALKKVL